jgi:hypothetical protein
VQLGRGAGADAGGEVRRERVLRGGQLPELRARRGVGVAERERAADAEGHPLEAEQDVLARDARGLLGDRRGDVRVAVAIRGDPVAEPEERGRHRVAHAGLVAEQPVVEQPVDARDDLEQRLVEHAHGGADLVERRGPRGAQGRGAPQAVDLLEQPPVDVLARERAGHGAVPLGEQVADAADPRGDRPTPRLGGVRREHRVEAHLAEAAHGLLAAELLGEPAHGVRDGVGHEARRGLALAEDAHAVVLLGQVGEVEVARERAGDLLRALGRERGDEPLGIVDGRVARALVRVDDQLAEALHVAEQLLPAGLAEHLAEQAAQVADVGAESGLHGVAGAVAGGVVLEGKRLLRGSRHGDEDTEGARRILRMTSEDDLDGHRSRCGGGPPERDQAAAVAAVRSSRGMRSSAYAEAASSSTAPVAKATGKDTASAR